MTDYSAKLGLPFLLPAQAQKHVTYNEAINQLDALVQLSVLSRTILMPVDEALDGAVYIVPEAALGSWQGQIGNLAVKTGSSWRFIEPQEGWQAWVVDQAQTVVFLLDEGWQTQSGQGGSEQVERFGVNTPADNVNRLSVNSEASLFHNNEGGHRLVINKATTLDTASIVFQSGFSGRAELGLTGDNSFRLRLSEDGDAFHDAIRAEPSGRIEIVGGLNHALLASAVEAAGGQERVYGPPNLVTVGAGRRTLTLVNGRTYFSPFYVDRPTRYLGANLALINEADSSGALLRSALYRVGQANGAGWDVGELVADLGVQAGDVPGHKDFEASEPIDLEPGWYLQAICINAAQAVVRGIDWVTPGVHQFLKISSGASADYRLAGIARYLTSNNTGHVVIDGFPAVWQDNPASDVISTVFSQHVLAIPYWDRRSWG